MTRVERLRLAASICLIGGSIDAAVLAGWAWPRVLAERSRIAASGPPAVAVVGKGPPVEAARPANSGAPSGAPAAIAPSPPVTGGKPVAPAETIARSGSGAPSLEPAPASAPPVGIILFRSRAGSRWSDPNKAFRRIVDLARDDPNLILRVDGYADHHGDRHDNRHLSLRRARKVAKLLQSAGCSPHQIIIHGHGEHTARATGQGRGARRWNRRVEIHVNGGRAP